MELHARNIIITFGAFLAVLIAIKIFLNIALYLRDDVVHVKTRRRYGTDGDRPEGHRLRGAWDRLPAN